MCSDFFWHLVFKISDYYWLLLVGSWFWPFLEGWLLIIGSLAMEFLIFAGWIGYWFLSSAGWLLIFDQIYWSWECVITAAGLISDVFWLLLGIWCFKLLIIIDYCWWGLDYWFVEGLILVIDFFGNGGSDFFLGWLLKSEFCWLVC